MTPYEELKDLQKNDLVQKWLEQCNRCAETQEAVLLDILKRAENTTIGRRYHFDQIKTIAQYQAQVPVSCYDDYKDEIKRMSQGAENVLFAGKAQLFMQTSGTTGAPKLIPESAIGLDVRYKVQDIREYLTSEAIIGVLKNNPHFDRLVAQKNWGSPDSVGRAQIFGDMHVMPLITAASGKQKTTSGASVDFASNVSAGKHAARTILTYPLEIARLKDKETMVYLYMLFALRFDDIVEIAGNHAGRLIAMIDYAKAHSDELINDLRHGTLSLRLNLSAQERQTLQSYLEPMPERADQLEAIKQKGDFVPKYYWPYLSGCVFWLSGSVGRQAYQLENLLPETTVCLDVGYGSSEAKINIPTRVNASTGALATFGGFFEFCRLEDGKIFTADQVEAGQKYTLLLTTYSGLYRYNLHDIVRVTGFNGNTPEITFVIREGDILNVGQEKFPADLLCQFVEEASAIALCQVWINQDKHRYELYLEPTPDEHRSLDQLANDLDDYLQNQFPPYSRYRQYNVIKPLQVHWLPSGRKETLLELSTKIPLVLSAPPLCV